MKDIASIHTPVLLDKCVGLVCGGLPGTGSPVIVDCTLGLAGHASAFLQANTGAQLIGIDRDRQALDLASRRMESLGLASRFTPVHAAFDEVSDALGWLGISHIDAAFMDLGLSSLQIDEDARGFSYSHDVPLDMRMDTSQTLTAKDILARYPQDALQLSDCSENCAVSREKRRYHNDRPAQQAYRRFYPARPPRCREPC